MKISIESFVFLDDIEIRNNALAVLRDEFLNQETLAGCIKEKIINILIDMLSSKNSHTRNLSMQALESASKSSIGITAILDEQCLPILINILSEDNPSLRADTYKIICAMTNFARGVDACVNERNVVKILITSLSKELDSIETNIQTLYNIVTFNEQGLRQAYSSDAVISCLNFINDLDQKASIRILAMKTLGFMCFDADSRKQAFQLDAVRIHASFLENFNVQSSLYIDLNADVVASSLFVLNGLTSDDDGKRTIYSCLGNGKAIEYIMPLINMDHTAVRLNTVKLLSNIAILPATRNLLLANSSFLDQLTKLTKDSNSTVAKHSIIALKAINWKP